jgi:hypothetical protein
VCSKQKLSAKPESFCFKWKILNILLK